MNRKKSPNLAEDDGGVFPRKGGVSMGSTDAPEDWCGGDGDEADLLREITAGIARLEYPSVPSSFVTSVMNRVQFKKMPWWYRCYRWSKSPHTVRITPLKLAPIAVGIVLAFYGLFSSSLLREGTSPQQLAVVSSEAGVTVTFQLSMPEARSVNLVGSFNEWNPRKCEMKRSGEATWTVVLQLPAGRYEYAFLVDGTTLVNDPDGAFYQDDGFGNRNNILVVGNNHEAAI